MIGVFDSGSGGLAILQALHRQLPDRDFVYLGDHAHAPYGNRSIDEIRALTRAGASELFEQGCRIVVVACNTAAAVALRQLQRDWIPASWPGRRLLGVFVPMVEAITGAPWDGKDAALPGGGPELTVGVFATPLTVLTCAWRDEIHRRAPQIHVVQQQCPGLAAMIEGDAPADDIDAAVGRFVTWLLARTSRVPDSVVLGCTHYSLIADRFAAALPAGVGIPDQPQIVAADLADYLGRHPGLDRRRDGGTLRFLTTAQCATSSRLAERFLGHPVEYHEVPVRLVA
jgi:glutamate racemase